VILIVERVIKGSGIDRGGSVNWNGNDWALNCDFKGQDMSNVSVSTQQCGPTCLSTYGCTHFTYNGGTCWMKNGLVTKADAFNVPNTDYVCGVNPIIWNSNNVAVACNFDHDGLTNTKTAKKDCATKCRATTGCTHYAWDTTDLGTCWMFTGTVSYSDAYYTGDLDSVCGIPSKSGKV
jgi:hypothetical protein